MNEFWGVIIGVASLVVLGFIVWGITSFIYWCIDKRDRKKWDITVAKYPEVLDYQNEANAWWKAYDKKSDEANGYKKQIDELIDNLGYFPSYEVEWRKEKAEEYKVLYFEAKTEADRLRLHYCEAHKKWQIIVTNINSVGGSNNKAVAIVTAINIQQWGRLLFLFLIIL